MKGEILYLNMHVSSVSTHEMTLAGIRRFSEMRGWNVRAVLDVHSRAEQIRTQFAKMRPMGCIVECSEARDDLWPEIFGDIPTVWLNCYRGFRGWKVPIVVHDDEVTTRAAFRELMACRPSAYAVVDYEKPRDWARVRVRTFRDLVAEGGYRCAAFIYRDEDPFARRRRLEAFLAKLPRHAAVFAVNDYTASEVIDVCHKIGKRIPADMTLVGVDNLGSSYGEQTSGLSSVQIDFERAGYRVAWLLDAIIKRRTISEKWLKYGPLMVVRRESTRGFGRRETRILSAVELIRREACNGLTAADVLKSLKGSRRLAELRFREMMGHSILDEILNVRLERVCFLLARTDTAIGAIAALCGFRSNIALSTLFHRRFGRSLSAWRKANRTV